MLRLYISILSVLVLNDPLYSQASASVEQYHYAGKGQPYVFMPVAYLKSASNWYAEARYNYEDMETFSLYLGRSFTGDNRLSYSVTPIIGAALGRFNGISTGLNVDLEFDKFFFSAQSQYTMATARGKGSEDFIYSWSEAGYQPLSWLYAGASFQQTYTVEEKLLEPGLVVGFSFDRFSIPVYAFNRYLIIGFTLSWEGTKKAGGNKQTKPVTY